MPQGLGDSAVRSSFAYGRISPLPRPVGSRSRLTSGGECESILVAVRGKSPVAEFTSVTVALTREDVPMNRLISLALLMAAVACVALAAPETPEIYAGSAAGAVTLLGGAMLVIRGRRKN